MTTGEKTGEDALDDFLLAYDDLADFFLYAVESSAKLFTLFIGIHHLFLPVSGLRIISKNPSPVVWVA